jgi:hypothetical protein
MSETGFYHPSRGYWQTNAAPSAAILATYPQGTVEVPLKPGPNYAWSGSAWVEQPAPPAPVPPAVDGFQFREQLRVQGVYDAALTAVTAAGGRTLRAFNEASVFGRGNPSFNALADALGYTEAQKDQFFRDAAAIRA